VRDSLRRHCANDRRGLINPAKTAWPASRPASITNGADKLRQPYTADDVRLDIRSVMPSARRQQHAIDRRGSVDNQAIASP